MLDVDMKDRLVKLVALLVIAGLAGAWVSLNQPAGLGQITLTSSPRGSDPPRQVRLTWGQNDTSHTIAITWKTTEENSGDQVLYDTESRGGENSLYNYSENGTHHAYSGLGGYIHDVELTGLSPNTVYYFVCGGENGGYSEERSFSTAPETSTSFTFVAGGDSRSGSSAWPGTRNSVSIAMAKFNPSFVLHAGDFVMHGDEQAEWDNFFEDIHEHWVGTDGMTIPIIPTIGNHEYYDNEYNMDLVNGPQKYLEQFALPENEKWYSLDWGPDLHIIVLNSEEVGNQDQRTWLENDLASHASTKWNIVVFHRPPFTASQSPGGDTEIRSTWVPLFDNYKVDLVIAGHHHLYHRTHPINYTYSEGAILPAWEGTTYIVTGGWGAPLSSFSSVGWWGASSRKAYHFVVVNVSEGGLSIKAIDVDGDVFDEAFIPAEAQSSPWLLVTIAVAAGAAVAVGLILVRRRRRVRVERIGGKPVKAARRWYISRSGKKYGPYSEAVMRRYIEEGRVNKNTIIWSKKMTGWKKITEVEAFKTRFVKQSRNA